MIITEQILLQGLSRNGGYSSRQVRLLGTHIKKNKGWKRILIGTSVPDENVKRFISLRNAHLPKSDLPGEISPSDEIKQLKDENKMLKKSIKFLTKLSQG